MMLMLLRPNRVVVVGAMNTNVWCRESCCLIIDGQSKERALFAVFVVKVVIDSLSRPSLMRRHLLLKNEQ